MPDPDVRSASDQLIGRRLSAGRRRGVSSDRSAAVALIGLLLICTGCSAMAKTAVEGIQDDGNAVNQQQTLEVKIAQNLYTSITDTGVTVAPISGYWRDCSSNLTPDRAQWIITTTVSVTPADPATQLDPLYQAMVDAGWQEPSRYVRERTGMPGIQGRKAEQVVTFDADGTSEIDSQINGLCVHSKVFGTAGYEVQPTA